MWPFAGGPDLRPQRLKSVERENSLLRVSPQRHHLHGELAVGRKRLQQCTSITLEGDAVAEGRRGASECNRMTVVDAVGDEVVVARQRDRRPRDGEFRAAAATTDRQAQRLVARDL